MVFLIATVGTDLLGMRLNRFADIPDTTGIDTCWHGLKRCRSRL